MQRKGSGVESIPGESRPTGDSPTKADLDQPNPDGAGFASRSPSHTAGEKLRGTQQSKRKARHAKGGLGGASGQPLLHLLAHLLLLNAGTADMETTQADQILQVWKFL